VVVQPVAVDEHRKQHGRLVERELPPDTGAFTGAERLERMRGARGLRLRCEARGVEQLGVVAPHRLPVQHRREHHDALPGTQWDPPAEQCVLTRVPPEHGGRGPQPQRLVEHLPGVRELPDLVERRLGVGRVAPQRVHLALYELEHGGVLGEVVERERHGAGGGLVARDQEGDHLVADVGGVERGAIDGVLGREHEPEQVLGGALSFGDPGLDHLVDHLRQVAGVALEGRVGRGVVLAGEAAQPGHAPLQAPDHGLDERMRLVPLEGSEVVAEPGKTDGVERHPRHVVGNVHRSSGTGSAVPRLDQPAHHLQHHRVIRPHRPECEGRHQDVVRLGPVRLVVVRREEPVRGELPHVLQSGPDMLGEPRLVGEFGHQLEVAHEQGVPPVQPPHEHRSVDPAQFHDLLQWGAAGSNGGNIDDRDTIKGSDNLRKRHGGGHDATTAFHGTEVTAVPASTSPRNVPHHGTTQSCSTFHPVPLATPLAPSRPFGGAGNCATNPIRPAPESQRPAVSPAE
jgi:hypothetical protein